MNNKLTKKLIFSALGLTLIVFGIALYIRANLGLTCGDVIPVAVSLFTRFSIGQCAMCFQVLCIIAQIIIVRKLKINHLVQLPLAFAYGALLDFFLIILRFELVSIPVRAMFLVLAILILAFGVRLMVGANILLMPLDGFAREIGNFLGGSMAKGKIISDVSMTLIGMLLTLILAKEPFLVVHVGTVFCALAAGPTIGLYTKLFPRLDLDKFTKV